MTHLPAVLDLLGAAKKTTSGNPAFLIILVGIAVLGYFFFLKPQQRKAQAARANANADIEVGDEIQTIGGVIGTVLEIHGDRYTILTGSLGDDGNLAGAQPTRIVFVRQAIARKIDPIVLPDDEPDVDDEYHDVEDEDEGPAALNGHDPAEAADVGGTANKAKADEETEAGEA